MTLVFDEIDSPIGTLLLVVGADSVCVLEFDTDAAQAQPRLERRFGTVELRPQTDPRGCPACRSALADTPLPYPDTGRVFSWPSIQSPTPPHRAQRS